MLTASEFADWFADYRSRFPAVGDYVDRVDCPAKVLDTWHANVSAFDVDILRAVTAAILKGDFEPVANVQLGMFGAEVRKLCRQVLDARREKDRREEWRRPKGDRYEPLIDGAMLDMQYAGLAVDDLLGTGSASEARLFSTPHSVSPDHPECGAYCAAIILADDHTALEDQRCRAKLAEHGLTWEQVQARAAELKALHTSVETEDQA